jgi:hypothetical protein
MLAYELSPLYCDYYQEANPRKRNSATQHSSALAVTVASMNETSTPFNSLEFPTDIVLLAVVWRLRYKLSLRDVAEMFLERGFVFTHAAIRDWETRFAPFIAEQLRTQRRGQAGTSWYVDAHLREGTREVVLFVSS